MQVCVVVQGQYLLEVRLNGYNNHDNSCVGCPMGNDSQGRVTGSCCDDFNRFNDCDGGGRRCDSYFFFCLRPFGSERLTGGCRGYTATRVSSVNRDDRLIDFTAERVLGLENPFLLPGLTEEYKVSIYLNLSQYKINNAWQDIAYQK